MKKVGLIVGMLAVFIGVFVFINKLYYPALPINEVSAKETINIIKKSDNKLAKLSTEEEYTWYITKSENSGILIADENIKEMVSSSGWEFKEKNGSGLFFEKDGEKLIITTQMWTKNYVLVKVPSHFD